MSKITSRKAFDKRKVPAYLIVIICFGCSALFSILGLKTQGSTDIAIAAFIALAIGSEIIKFEFPAVAITSKDMHIGLRTCFAIIGLTAIFFSITFSFAFSKHETATIKKMFVDNSTETKMAEKKSSDRDKLISRLDSELSDLEADKKAAVEKIDPVRYRTQRNNVSKEYQKKIDKKSAELTKTQKEGLSSTLPKVNGTATVGITGIFDTVEQENMFFKGFAIFMEFGGVFGLVSLKRKRRKVLKQYTVYEDEEQDDEPEYEKPYSPARPGIIDRVRSIFKKPVVIEGFKAEPRQAQTEKKDDSPTPEVSEAIKAYASTAIKYPGKDSSCPGITKMAKLIKADTRFAHIDRTALVKAHSYLEQKKIIRVDGSTYINNIAKLTRYI